MVSSKVLLCLRLLYFVRVLRFGLAPLSCLRLRLSVGGRYHVERRPWVVVYNAMSSHTVEDENQVIARLAHDAHSLRKLPQRFEACRFIPDRILDQERVITHRGKAQGNGVLFPRGEPAVCAARADDDRRSFFMRDEPIMVVLNVTYDRRVVCLKRAYIHVYNPLPDKLRAPLYKMEAQRSGFHFERKKEGAAAELVRQALSVARFSRVGMLFRKPHKRSSASFF